VRNRVHTSRQNCRALHACEAASVTVNCIELYTIRDAVAATPARLHDRLPLFCQRLACSPQDAPERALVFISAPMSVSRPISASFAGYGLGNARRRIHGRQRGRHQLVLHGIVQAVFRAHRRGRAGGRRARWGELMAFLSRSIAEGRKFCWRGIGENRSTSSSLACVHASPHSAS